MPKITITDGAGVTRDFSVYYDFSRAPFSFSETYDRQRGRSKTANIELFKVDSALVTPQEDNILKIYRDNAGTDLVFGGVIQVITRKITGIIDTTWVVDFSIQAVGYDPQTLNYQEVVDYKRINIKAGQVLKDLVGTYAPWINTTNIEITTSPLVRRIAITRRSLSSVVQDIITKTDWTFYVDDNANAYFNTAASLLLNWGLTEGTKPNYFPEFDNDTLAIDLNVQEAPNDITVIGGIAKGSRVVETLTWNGQDGAKSLQTIPFGLESVIQFFDTHDDTTIDQKRWYENDTANKLTESSGRLQVASGINNTGIIVSKNLFSRDDNIEVRFAEFEIVSFAAGKATLGVHNGTQDTVVTNFLHALEFDQASGSLRTREGATVVTFGSIPIGVGIFAIRIRVKATGGASYFIQGGRTSTPKEYGELGSKSWTKVTETASDTTSLLAIAQRFDTTIGCTVIRSKVATDINLTVTLIAGGKLGSGSPVGSDTLLTCGLESALDFETDCFISVSEKDTLINFFTDNKPLGDTRITYWSQDNGIRERVFDSANKSVVDSRSALVGDDGTRTTSAIKEELIIDAQDARDLAISFLNNTSQYRGSFSTTSWHLSNIIPVGDKPISGRRITINLPNTWGYSSFSEVITAVSGKDIGTNDIQYDVSFGEGNISFERFMLHIRNKALIDIVDDAIASVDSDSEDKATASTPRVDQPTFLTASYIGTGVSISWNAVSGASLYEVRDNLFRGQGQGGSFVYQKSSATSYAISAASINATHKKRNFTFYIWSITTGGQYSKYPLTVTVENPRPIPQPIRDLTNPNGLVITIRFAPEVESDILSSGRRIQIATDRAMTALVIDADISKTIESTDFSGSADTVYYIRYGLKDDYTVALGDISYSGIREIKTGAADFSGSKQFLNNIPPDNSPSGVGITSNALIPGIGHTIDISWSYTQGTNIATGFGIIIRRGGGTPTLTDDYHIVESNKTSFTWDVPGGGTFSFGIFAFAVTRGGITRNTTISSLINQNIGSTQAVIEAPSGGDIWIGTLIANNIIIGNVSGTTTISGTPLKFSTNLKPSATDTINIGTSSSDQFLGIYGKNIYRNGSEINSLYAAASHTHAKADLPSATVYDDESNTFVSTNDFGASSGKILIRYVSAASVTTTSREIVIWGDTGSGNTYLVFDTGGGQIKVLLS